ncbi:TPA: hypothetical protein N0F65_008240 [Lagenidium giganteum]|uniref:Tryptophan synthase beta chain-like PALP domain-containing protein n=1 Tax=Lagenidium giganteum TaxID=4803 RepID=A0AAV2Z1E9_9STRA|nr:TPA: hypothetical protein N0F65_008240 [Lagenidium giganteum]
MSSSTVPFVAPRWAAALSNQPKQRIKLGYYPTPIAPFSPPGLPSDVKMFIKREDMCGVELSGNKARKLELLLADALEKGADCVVTLGGVNSSHCRATTVAAKMLGLDVFLIVITDQPNEDPGLKGNLLVSRMMDATILQVTAEEVAKLRGEQTIQRVCNLLKESGRRPYPIPVGGSNGMGCWGHISAIDEIHKQLEDLDIEVTDIAVACGSAGTATGLSIGAYLYAQEHPNSSLDYNGRPPVHAYIICDFDSSLYVNHINNKLLPAIGVDKSIQAQQLLQFTNAQEPGYAKYSPEHMDFVIEVARTTGVMLDPTYTGKALYHLMQELKTTPEKFAGKTILFMHTGGFLGVFHHDEDLEKRCRSDQVQRFHLIAIMLKAVPFVSPKWASALRSPPATKLKLGHFPTPIFPFRPPGLPNDVKLYIKRDDFSGMETSGNKMRKLEFLFADALNKNADCVVTCGGIQSNHCRATAVVARMLGLDSYLLLRTNAPDEDPGLIGNLLVDRLVDSQIIQMSRKEYGTFGSEAMIEKTCEKLRAEGRRPYAIPVGGSNGLGTWGYVQAIEETHTQLKELELEITDLAFACGSGGTAGGIGVGAYLHAQHNPNGSLNFKDKTPVHAYIVCDNAEYFFNHIDNKILPEMGADPSLSSRDFLQITNAQGTGYARSTKDELEFIVSVARSTGVLMDPVYSGKALFHLIKELNNSPEKFSGKSILFIHTGGLFGLYDKADELQKLMMNQRTALRVMQRWTTRARMHPSQCSRIARFSTATTDKYDVVIVGGGVMGCSTAFHLATTSDLSIAIVERDASYKRASCVLSAGGIRQQFSERENILMSQYGAEFLHSAPTRLHVDGDDPPDMQFVQGGYLFLASEKGASVLQNNFVTQRNVGSSVEMLNPEQLKQRFPWISTEGVVAGTLGTANEGWFDPWSFLVAMKKKCVSLGVDLISGDVKALDLTANGQSITAVHLERSDAGQTTKRSLKTAKVVNAAGAWASKIVDACGISDYPVRPRKRSAFVFHCPHEETWKGPAASPLVVDPSGVYFRREGSGGQFICGVSPTSENDFDGLSDDELDFPDHELFENVVWPTIAERVQKFEDVKLLSAWAGWYEYNTFDQNAIIGKHPDVSNLYLINGFSGHGIQQAAAAGRAVSELIVDGKYQTIDLSRFGFERVRENKPFFEKNIV